jgi:hypothetical protein
MIATTTAAPREAREAEAQEAETREGEERLIIHVPGPPESHQLTPDEAEELWAELASILAR